MAPQWRELTLFVFVSEVGNVFSPPTKAEYPLEHVCGIQLPLFISPFRTTPKTAKFAVFIGTKSATGAEIEGVVTS